jgi:iron complex transport system substrate-binding protein
MVNRLAILLLLAASCFAQPRRIVSTAPSITEMLYALGLGERVAGVTDFCRYPPEAALKPKIGGYLHPNLEAVIALRPDLVIAEKSMVREAFSLPGLKLKLLEVDDSTIQGIYESIETISRAAGVGERGKDLASKLAGELAMIRNRAARPPRPRVLFVVGRTPGRIEDLIAAGGPSYLSEVMRIAGGENVFQDAAIAYAKVSLEEVLSRDPDIIIDMGEMSQTIGVTEGRKQAVVALWRRYPFLKAVRENKVFAVASDIYVVPGPRVVEAARELARLFHPEAVP